MIAAVVASKKGDLPATAEFVPGLKRTAKKVEMYCILRLFDQFTGGDLVPLVRLHDGPSALLVHPWYRLPAIESTTKISLVGRLTVQLTLAPPIIFPKPDNVPSRSTHGHQALLSDSGPRAA